LKHIEKKDVGEEKDEGRHSLEWRFTAKKDILNKTIMEELNAHPKLWQYAVIFGAQSWKIILSPEKITNFQRPASKRDERPAFGETTTDTFIPGVLKVGDFGWVVYIGRTKKLVASKGKIVGVKKMPGRCVGAQTSIHTPRMKCMLRKRLHSRRGKNF